MAIRLITPSQLINAPTGIDWSSINENAGADDPAQTIEATNLIDRASWWAANFCDQPLGLHATTQTEQARTGTSASIGDQVWVDKYAALNFKAATLPVLSVTSAQWSPLNGSALDWQSITGWSILGTYPQQRHLVNQSQWWGFLKARPALVEVTYVSGWANALLQSPATASPSAPATLTVDTTLGMSVGQLLNVYDSQLTEQVQVTAVVDSTHVTVASLQNYHAAGVGVSAVPPDMQEAIILACVHFARQRGEEVFGIDGRVSTGPVDDSLTEAQNLLGTYAARI